MAEKFGFYLVGSINLLKSLFIIKSLLFFLEIPFLYLKSSLHFKEILAILEKHDRIKNCF